MAGVLYSLVALGFVLIFKASGVFNYAQGVMALFAALTLVGLQDGAGAVRAPALGRHRAGDLALRLDAAGGGGGGADRRG